MHYFIEKYSHRILIRYICCHCAENDYRHVYLFFNFFVHDFCSQQIFKAFRYTTVNFETINALSFRIIVNVITFAFFCLLFFRIFFKVTRVNASIDFHISDFLNSLIFIKIVFLSLNCF